MHLSTGAANAAMLGLIGGASITIVGLNYGVIDVYSGPMPTAADDAKSGTRLGRFTKASAAWTAGTTTNGLRLDSAAGVASIHSGDTWSCVAEATGTVGYARWKGNALDDDLATTTLVRVDLTVSAGGGAECNLSSLTFTSGATETISSTALTQPKS